MKTLRILVAAASALAGALALPGQIIARWTFETSPPGSLTNTPAISGIAADVGSGTASGVHAGAGTDWSTPAGNGSTESLSANTWAVGDYFQFSVSTVGFRNIAIDWSQLSSSTGPTSFKLAYSANGGAFTDFVTYAVSTTTWSTFSHSLAAISALDDTASVSFRLINQSTVTSTGASRVDDITISGARIAAPSAVPEASTYGMLAGGALVAATLLRRLRRRSPR